LTELQFTDDRLLTLGGDLDAPKPVIHILMDVMDQYYF
jgi:hypothetical protein